MVCNGVMLTKFCFVLYRYTWFTTNMSYTPHSQFTGYDEFKVVARDRGGLYSKELSVQAAVLKNPCVNGGLCKGKS